ncbi:hypothetical protein E4U42_002086 [Claviceps africana]|uniref:Uncharacterized protein n=1 Tax=Claviceps africana TaxID=83212 RepID=A0A8K0NMJ0_9HYPO|nr:hypothetical protein E4U42_002086 [Claviceps africana]
MSYNDNGSDDRRDRDTNAAGRAGNDAYGAGGADMGSSGDEAVRMGDLSSSGQGDSCGPGGADMGSSGDDAGRGPGRTGGDYTGDLSSSTQDDPSATGAAPGRIVEKVGHTLGSDTLADKGREKQARSED